MGNYCFSSFPKKFNSSDMPSPVKKFKFLFLFCTQFDLGFLFLLQHWFLPKGQINWLSLSFKKINFWCNQPVLKAGLKSVHYQLVTFKGIFFVTTFITKIFKKMFCFKNLFQITAVRVLLTGQNILAFLSAPSKSCLISTKLF